jgi:pimeloyl-ACP methyl ester carboxylesterase
MNSFPENGTVVLVHGAWADGSSWRQVICLLQRQGIRVIAAPIPLTSLSDDVAALRRALERTDGPVLLAAHAYAGAVISVPNEERIKALVYIAALTPDEGETVAQVFYREQPHPSAPHLKPDVHDFIWMPEEGFRNAFAHNGSSELTALLAAVQRPIALQCINEVAPAPSWKTKPSWFLLAEEDRMISPKTQRSMAERMRANIRSEAVDHAPLLTAPDLVVDLILAAARATLS